MNGQNDICASPPRIGVLLSSLADMGGAIRVATLLANRLADDFPVTVIELAAGDALAFPVDERVDVVSLDADRGARLRRKLAEVPSALKGALREHAVDVVLGIGLDETAVATRACRSAHVPLVFCDHGALVNQLDDKVTTLLRRVCARLCAATVVLTQQSMRDYEQRFHVPSERLRCIPNWIPRRLLADGRPYEGASKRILWAGRLDGEKGVDLLFDIASRVLPRYPDWTWDVFGEAVLKNGAFDLAGAVAQSPIRNQMRLLGKVDDLYERYHDYAIGTLTSYREGLPLFLLEGKAAGLPLMSFDVDTGPRDIIEEGADGFLVPPYDCEAYAECLGRLMDDADLRVRMSAHARKTAETFSEEAVYGRWIELIKQVTGYELG